MNQLENTAYDHLVRIQVWIDSKEISHGTGVVFIDGEEIFCLTANHCIYGTNKESIKITATDQIVIEKEDKNGDLNHRFKVLEVVNNSEVDDWILMKISVPESINILPLLFGRNLYNYQAECCSKGYLEKNKTEVFDVLGKIKEVHKNHFTIKSNTNLKFWNSDNQHIKGLSGSGVYIESIQGIVLVGIMSEVQDQDVTGGLINCRPIDLLIEHLRFENFINFEGQSNKLPANHFVQGLTKIHPYCQRKLVEVSKQKSTTFILSTDDIVFKQDQNKILIIDHGGMGKTIELEHLAFKAIENDFTPILIYLRQFSSTDSITSLITNQRGEKWLVLNPKKVLILDGFDEIPDNLKNAFLRALRFYTSNHNHQIIIGTRSTIYDKEFSDNFTIFKLKEIDDVQIDTYLSEKGINSNDLQEGIKKIGIVELLKVPFYLNFISDFYLQKKQLPSSPKLLIQELLAFRLNQELDRKKMSNDLELHQKYKQQHLFKIVSTVMELSNRLFLTEEQLWRISGDQLDNVVSYAMLIQEGLKSNEYRFEHKLFMDMYCAQFFASIEVNQLKQEISKNPTLYFNINLKDVWELFSLIDETNFLESIDHFRDYVVNQEQVDLLSKGEFSTQFRFDFFKDIYKRYKENKTLLYSRKFTNGTLIGIADNNRVLEFLYQELSTTSQLEDCLNALDLIRYCDLVGYEYTRELNKKVLGFIDSNSGNLNQYVIGALMSFPEFAQDNLKKIMKQLSVEKHQTIRSSIYAFITKTNQSDKSIKYLIDGVKLLKVFNEERGEIRQFDEQIWLREALLRCKNYSSLDHIISAYKNFQEISEFYNKENLFSDLVSLSIKYHQKGRENLFDSMYSLLESHNKMYYTDQSQIEELLRFFNETKTALKAYKLSIKRESFDFETSQLVVSFLTKRRIDSLVKEIKNKGNDCILLFYKTILNSNNRALSEPFKAKVNQFLSEKISFPIQINWNEINKNRTQKSFDKLFDETSFFKECDEIKKSLSDNFEKMELIKKRRPEIDVIQKQEDFAQSAVDYIVDSLDNNINGRYLKNKLEIKKDRFEYFRIQYSVQLIRENPTIEIHPSSLKILKEWFDKQIVETNFKKAIIPKPNSGFSYEKCLEQIFFLLKKFSFHVKEGTLLNMLNSAYEGFISFEELTAKIIDKEVLIQRIQENINNGTSLPTTIYLSHVRFAIDNKISTTYSSIIRRIINNDLRQFETEQILHLFVENDEGIVLLQSKINKLSIEQKLFLLERFISKNGSKIEWIREQLEKLYKENSEQEFQRRINQSLIDIQALSGLKNTLSWVKEYNLNPFDSIIAHCSGYTDHQALPLLLELLELSIPLDIPKETNKYYRMYNQIINSILYFSNHSLNNFQLAKAQVKEFIKKHENDLDRLQIKVYLNNRLGELEEDITSKNSLLSLNEAKKLVKRLDGYWD